MPQSTIPEPASAAEVLHAVANAVAAGLAHPMDVGLYAEATGYPAGLRTVDIRLADDAVTDLVAWVDWLDLDAITVGPLLTNSGRDWRPHESAGTWQGWQVEVWTAVTEPVDEPATDGAS